GADRRAGWDKDAHRDRGHHHRGSPVCRQPQMKDGEVLGLIITNPEDVPHSFDIDSLDIHVQVSPETTTVVVIQPTGPGTLEFYCSVHTHRERGMVGSITVE
ncbi:MAG TPA: cupredoxin domain-containing protein, partial [Candidatus Limnocylindrales bacterium]|nr:cupredoxin domain-containing protein [Candidatus Limnocylindrales bacterium]